MQYLLTEQEYKALVDAPKIIEKKTDKIIADLCRRVALHEPTEDTGRPYGCVQEYPSSLDCDDCPLQDVCTYDRKSWSD